MVQFISMQYITSSRAFHLASLHDKIDFVASLNCTVFI